MRVLIILIGFCGLGAGDFSCESCEKSRFFFCCDVKYKLNRL